MSPKPKDIVLVTCAEWPELSVSDQCLAAELTAQGHRVHALAWNVSEIDRFTSVDIVVLRSNWDYHHAIAAFEEWLTMIDKSSAELHNPAGLVRSYLDKSYVERLHADGFRVPQTLVTSDFELDEVHDWMTTHDLDRIVLKPAWGASGHGVELVKRNELAGAAERWRAYTDRRPVLVQEFMPQIHSGELALVFFGGEFSHALSRRPSTDDFRVNGQFGGTMQLATAIDPTVIEFASKVEATLPEPVTYARIDVIADGSDHIVMEVEVNEPALGLHLAPGSAARFAAALVS